MTSGRPRTAGRIGRSLVVQAAIVTVAVVLAFCIPLALYVRTVAYDRAIDSAEAQTRSLAAVLASAPTRVAATRLVRGAATAGEEPAFAYLQGGGVIGKGAPRGAAAREMARLGRAMTVAAAGGAQQVWQPVRGRSPVEAVMIAVPADELTRGVAGDWLLIFGGGALLVVVATVLAGALGRRIVRPIRALEHTARRLRDGDLDERVAPAGPREVAEVGRAMNELAERIVLLLENARLTAADLGHRLRTPLTALHLDIQSLPDDRSRAHLLADVDALENALTVLIHETRDGSHAVAQQADLARAVRERMAFWSLLARAQDRPVVLEATERAVPVALTTDEVDAAIDAVVSNVFRHTPVGTGFCVRLAPSVSVPGSWSLVVEDDGPAAPLPNGRRGARRGSGEALVAGTGLGLDIVRRTAARGGGRAEAGARPEGGFRVVLTLPERGARAGGDVGTPDIVC